MTEKKAEQEQGAFSRLWAGAQAVDLHAKGRICPYCRANECADGMMNCLPCMQNAKTFTNGVGCFSGKDTSA